MRLPPVGREYIEGESCIMFAGVGKSYLLFGELSCFRTAVTEGDKTLGVAFKVFLLFLHTSVSGNDSQLNAVLCRVCDHLPCISCAPFIEHVVSLYFVETHCKISRKRVICVYEVVCPEIVGALFGGGGDILLRSFKPFRAVRIEHHEKLESYVDKVTENRNCEYLTRLHRIPPLTVILILYQCSDD